MGTLNLQITPESQVANPRTVKWDGSSYGPMWVLDVPTVPRIFSGWANPSKEGYVMRAGDTWVRDARAAPPNFILDTDLSSDVDDCQDVKTALTLHAEGKINLLGIVVSMTNQYGPAVVAAFQIHYFGSVIIPIASIYADDNNFNYAGTAAVYSYLYNNFPHTGYGLQDSGGPILQATVAVRQWLAASTGAVRYVMTGTPQAMMRTYTTASGIGGISGTGAALFAAKVDRVYWAAGLFPSGGHRGLPSPGYGGVIGDGSWGSYNEFNFVANGDSTYGTQALLATSFPLTMIGIEFVSGVTEPPNSTGTGPARAQIGPIGGSGDAARRPATDILRTAYTQWGNGREPWGMAAIMWAGLWQEENLWGITETTGTVTDDFYAVSGFTVSSGGPHKYVVLPGASVSSVRTQMTSLQAADCVRGAYTWSGSAWA
jgi:hypothetical protein